MTDGCSYLKLLFEAINVELKCCAVVMTVSAHLVLMLHSTNRSVNMSINHFKV